MNSNKYRNILMFTLIISCSFLNSCEDFVEVEPPSHKMISETVFENDNTAKAAIKGIYNELFNADFSNGYISSVTILAGMSSDIFETTSNTDDRYRPFQQNEISPGEFPDATANYNLWNSAYNVIYMTNSILEGLENSNSISEEIRKTIIGQAKFLRAFSYFNLTNIYGDVPLLLTTDYRLNAGASRDSATNVWLQIEEDLDESLLLLEEIEDYPEGERTNITKYVVLALRARVYLYQKDWEKAESMASQVIGQASHYELLDDLNQVFLKNSREAIWQISPIGNEVTFIELTYTKEGYFFRGINSSPVKLSDDFIKGFDLKDRRLSQWTGFNENREFYYPQKYKDGNSLGNITEYSMILRLAEQYLIRAEALVMQGKLSDAIANLDVIRGRAGLDLISNTNPGIREEALLKEIMKERKREFFSEWGHRWLDLKRTGKASEVLAIIKPHWEPTDIYFPIPNEERAKNPNLDQNNGY